MSRPIREDYHQILLLPPCVEDWVHPDSPARFVRDFVRMLDLKAMGFWVSVGVEGRPHYSAELLLGVWLLGFMDRKRSSRVLEKACLFEMPFIWMSCWLKPDHNTLWRFIDRNRPLMRDLFKRIVLVAKEAGLVGFVLHAIDGTKVQSACSTETALHKDRLEKELNKLVDATMAEIDKEAADTGPDYSMPQAMQDGERRRQAIREALAKLEAQDAKHLNPIEPEAKMMKSRQGKRLGYNPQIVVDHDSDLIVAEATVQDQNDLSQAVPMLDEAKANLGQAAQTTVMDGGYRNGQQLAEAEAKGYGVLTNGCADGSSEKGFAKQDFRYDAERDLYICPLGEQLKFDHLEKPGKVELVPRGWYRCHKQDCPVRDKCTQDKKGRTVKRTPYDEVLDRQRQAGQDPGNRKLLSLRKELVAHPFGVIKAIDGFWRLPVRGLYRVRAQWALVCAAYDLRKLYVFWRDGQLKLRPA